ncbi:MAG: prepilin-type N-terminal cleavage/methylation domain-containing protein [Patescibacteria group bacterium]|nr:prepilin-type N-terminal cleavage/methylation domain-containing protein [Patescibacteria group bacterium]
MLNNKGFTLIETLVVIAIIGLLSSVVVIGLGGARSKARDARRIADIRSIQSGLEVDYTAVAGYPATIPANAPQTDPQGTSYAYEIVGTEGYLLGICLENTEGTTGAAPCPAAGVSCVGNEYCVSQ